MKDLGLKVLQGGKAIPFSEKKKNFISAYVTNTRLMGVVAVCIKWQVTECGVPSEFYQLFYYDAEEYGLDTYKGISSRDMNHFVESELTMIGGLGGQKIPITLDEAKYLVKSFIDNSISRNIPLPDEKKDYMFLAENVSLTEEQVHSLWEKMCGTIKSDYHLINYFVMRCFGKDFEAADYLTNGFTAKDYWPNINASALCKNTIDRYGRPYGKFMCQSVLDVDGKYYIATSLIEVENLKVISYEPVSIFSITPVEASLLLDRPEYITLFDCIASSEDFDRYSTPLTEKSMITEHEFGKVYMIFNPTNNHVDSQVFMLNGDVFGIYYHSDSNQLLLAAYSEQNISALEDDLINSKIGAFCILRGRYRFEEPLIFKFIQSGYQRFEEFLNFLTNE